MLHFYVDPRSVRQVINITYRQASFYNTFGAIVDIHALPIPSPFVGIKTPISTAEK